MTPTNAIKKATKLSGSKPFISGQFYNFPYKGYNVSFAQNGTENQATCFYTKRNDLDDDMMTDYFAGTFHDNITQCFKFIDSMTKSKN